MREPVERTDAPAWRFRLEIDAAEELAHDTGRVDALITARAEPRPADEPRRAGPGGGDVAGAAAGGRADRAATQFAEILIMDRSLSMATGGKIGEAKRAACAAVDALPDGAHLGVIAGNQDAAIIFSGGDALAQVDPAVREAAKDAIRRLIPRGGTRIGKWLTAAADLFGAAGVGTVCHAALYTDGRDEHESAEQLTRALEACADRFVCDARGLGEDFNYDEVLRITEALHGEAGAVIDVSDLTDDFTRLMAKVRSLLIPRVYLGLRINDRFRVTAVRQVRPVEADLTGLVQRDGTDVHVPLGAWSTAEARQYLLALTVDPDALPVGQRVRAGRISVLTEAADGSRTADSEAASVIVRRLATVDMPSPQPPQLTRAERIHDLGLSMRALADAVGLGQYEAADRWLRDSIQLARALDDAQRLPLLEGVAEVGADGRLRVRRKLGRGVVQMVGIESTRSGPVPKGLDSTLRSPILPITRVCPACGESTRGTSVKVCEVCGHVFGEASSAGSP